MVFKIPAHEKSLFQFGEAERHAFDSNDLRLLVWNVWKGRRGARFRADFMELIRDRDLVLLQEAVTAPWMSALWDDPEHPHEWHLAASFQWTSSHENGVATGALARPLARKFVRGASRELFLWTPKVSLGTLYSIPGGETLLVINTHVVNFTTTAAFVHFVRELVLLIEDHEGPIVLAGDFNTWNFKRWQSLVEILVNLGLEPVNFDADPRLLKLDHVFARGLKLVHAQVRGDIESSDHYPLMVEFRLS